jgi:3-isopropylmalate dehydrogenase
MNNMMSKQIRLEGILPGWEAPKPRESYLIGVLPGEGIGPEVIGVALQVLDEGAARMKVDFAIKTGGEIGLAALKKYGQVLTPEVEAFCESVFAQGGAVLCGPAAGRFVYELRSRFGLYCKISPIRPLKILQDAGVIRPEARADVDVLLVRENTGGVYFGRWEETRDKGDWLASHYFDYHREEVERVLQAAAGLALQRRKTLTLVVKSEGMPSISRVWMETAQKVAAGSDLRFQTLQVDHAAFQLIQTARDFDVVVTSNLFGDILADNGGLLLGSRGMCYSGNFGKNGLAVYQTGHGSANDLAHRNLANPVGQILSLVMMLEVSFGLADLADSTLKAVVYALGEGWRTADIAGKESNIVGTKELGNKIRQALKKIIR